MPQKLYVLSQNSNINRHHITLDVALEYTGWVGRKNFFYSRSSLRAHDGLKEHQNYNPANEKVPLLDFVELLENT